jgi:hypothetical protein
LKCVFHACRLPIIMGSCLLAFVIVIGLLSILSGVSGLRVVPNSLEGTESFKGILTDKQLAIQRWFAQLTILQDTNSWIGWGEEVVNDIHCDGNTCVRYEISGLAYAAAILGATMPAYTQLSEQILVASIDKMIERIVWNYVELFNDFQEQPTFPDPVAYKNIMYSGHLAQVIKSASCHVLI